MFFAQLMVEMLTSTTFESFRVYSLDTKARLQEALQICSDVQRQRIPHPTLEPIAEELIWSLGKDPAAKFIADKEIYSVCQLLKTKGFSIGSAVAHFRLIEKMISGTYKIRIEELILEKFSKSNEKIEIRKLSGFYCSHLINLGYSRQYILDRVMLYFFSTDIQRIGKSSLSRFFREFDGHEKKYTVTAAVTRDFAQYLERIGQHISGVDEVDFNFLMNMKLQDDDQHTQLVDFKCERLDPYGAMDACYQFLSAQRAISYLDPHGMHVGWSNTMYALRQRAKDGIFIAQSDFLSTRKFTTEQNKGNRAVNISRIARNMRENFDRQSTERLISSVKTASLARASGSPENQLISLWSSIEVLLSEPRDQPRIVHYVALIVPCIVALHSRRQFRAILEELLIGHRRQFNSLLRSIPNYRDVIRDRIFAQIILLPEFEKERAQLTKILQNNPLALHRVWKLRNDYKDTKSTSRTIEDHFDRVRWQMHRIYRARNQLVHAGQMPSYLESIILNLMEYYRSAVSTIILRSRKEFDESDIDQTVSEIGIRYTIFQREFSAGANTPLTGQHVALLLDPI